MSHSRSTLYALLFAGIVFNQAGAILSKLWADSGRSWLDLTPAIGCWVADALIWALILRLGFKYGRVSVIWSAMSILLAATIGALIFKERPTFLWYIGATLIALGLAIAEAA